MTAALDPENPVVRLCAAGVAAEQAGCAAEAAARYRDASQAASDDFERAIAAHYLARVQEDEGERLRLNCAAVDHAVAVGEAATPFLPSLYLNLGHSHEQLGDEVTAALWYERAADALHRAADAALAESLGPAISRARARLHATARDGR